MANGDYGYFGKGSTGYAQYMTAFNRNFGGSSGGGGGRAGAYCYGKLKASPRCRVACGKRRKKLKKHLTLTLRHSVY